MNLLKAYELEAGIFLASKTMQGFRCDKVPTFFHVKVFRSGPCTGSEKMTYLFIFLGRSLLHQKNS